MKRFAAIPAVLNKMSDDGRLLEALTVDPEHGELILFVLKEGTEGHVGAEPIGVVDFITPVGSTIVALGTVVPSADIKVGTYSCGADTVGPRFDEEREGVIITSQMVGLTMYEEGTATSAWPECKIRIFEDRA